MRAITRIIVALGVTAIVAAAWAFISFSRAQKTEIESPLSDYSSLAGSEIIDGYKQWARVNPVPVIMQSAVAALCADIRQSRMDHENPHRDKFITVYVNDIGRQAMMEQKVPRFPQNSVIVKEKLPTKDSSEPELLTVMVKREPGYSVENGDWEFMVFDGPGKSVRARGKLEACQGCHRMVKNTDYVSRSYLPQEVRKKLK